jgi:energy-coupling factor transport system permease protein
MSASLSPSATSSPLARVNPLAKFVVAAVIGLVLLVSLDWVSALIALTLELFLLPLVGLAPSILWRMLAPIVIAAPFAGLSTLLYGRPGGDILWQVGPILVTNNSVDLALAITLRVLAIGLPGIVLFATTDPTDLADALGQLWHLPSRFVIGALAAVRMVSLMAEDWRMLALARRARGVADGQGPLAAITRLFSQGFALLVLSVRRGSVLATAMEARAFGGPTARTWARTSVFGYRDVLFVMAGVMLAAIAVAASVLSGEWNFVIS